MFQSQDYERQGTPFVAIIAMPNGTPSVVGNNDALAFFATKQNAEVADRICKAMLKQQSEPAPGGTGAGGVSGEDVRSVLRRQVQSCFNNLYRKCVFICPIGLFLSFDIFTLYHLTLLHFSPRCIRYKLYLHVYFDVYDPIDL
jgi:hypothetical protein